LQHKKNTQPSRNCYNRSGRKKTGGKEQNKNWTRESLCPKILLFLLLPVLACSSCKNKDLIFHEKPARSFTLLIPVLLAVVDFLFYYFYEENDLSFNLV
jgi:hypothetical protein